MSGTAAQTVNYGRSIYQIRTIVKQRLLPVFGCCILLPIVARLKKTRLYDTNRRIDSSNLTIALAMHTNYPVLDKISPAL